MMKWDRIKRNLIGAGIMVGASSLFMAAMLYYYHLRGVM